MRLTKRIREIDISVILTFILVYVSNDTLLFGTNERRVFFYMHIGILLMTALYILSFLKRINKNALIYTLYLSATIIITQLVNQDGEIVKYIYNLVLLFLCMFFCSYISFDRFSRAYVSVMHFISLCAIIAVTINFVAPVIITRLPIVTNVIGRKFRFYGVGFLRNASGISRLYGVFREPGVFASFLSLSLVLQLFYFRKLSLKRIMVTIITMFLTFSTAAYILTSAIFLVYFLEQVASKNRRKKKTWMYYLAVCFVVIVMLTAIGFDTTYSFVFSKLEGGNASLNSRFGSIAANLRIFIKDPVFGKGWNFVEDNFATIAAQGTFDGRHNTNTFLKFLAIYGIGPFLFSLFLHFKLYKKICQSTIWGLLLTIIWAAVLSNEDLSLNNLFYLLPMYAFSNQNREQQPTYKSEIETK